VSLPLRKSGCGVRLRTRGSAGPPQTRGAECPANAGRARPETRPESASFREYRRALPGDVKFPFEVSPEPPTRAWRALSFGAALGVLSPQLRADTEQRPSLLLGGGQSGGESSAGGLGSLLNMGGQSNPLDEILGRLDR